MRKDSGRAEAGRRYARLAGWTIAALTAVSACATSNGTVPASSVSPADSASVAGSGAAGGASPAGGPVPAGFVARDFTFVSSTSGWLLGTAPCTSAPCTSIVHTTDGGHSWVGLPAPRATLEANGQNGCSNGVCVRGLRFGDGNTGYAYGSSALYLTRDGGQSWNQLPGQADAIEIANGTVVRVSSTSQGCPPGCTYTFSWAPLGRTSFTPAVVHGSLHLVGNNVQVARTGHRAFAELYANPAGGAGNAQAVLLASADDGRTWTSRSDPCGTYRGAEADSVQLAVADDGSLTVLCRSRARLGTFVLTSTDGGASFGAQRVAPVNADAVGAASATTLVVDVRDAKTSALYRSGDGGVTWARVASDAVSTQRLGGTVAVGFENGTTGRWAPGGADVFTTTDAGRTWTHYTFAR